MCRYGSDKVKAAKGGANNKPVDKTGSKYPPASKPDPSKDKHLLNTKPNPAAKKTTGYYDDDDDDDDDFQGIKPVNNKYKKPASRDYDDDDDDDDISYGGKNHQKTKGHYDDDDDDWDPKKPKKNPVKPGDKKRGSLFQDSDDDWDHDKKKPMDHGGHGGKKEEDEYIYLKIAVVKKDGKYDLRPLDHFDEPIPPVIRKDGSKLYTKKSPSNSPDYHNGRYEYEEICA